MNSRQTMMLAALLALAGCSASWAGRGRYEARMPAAGSRVPAPPPPAADYQQSNCFPAAGLVAFVGVRPECYDGGPRSVEIVNEIECDHVPCGHVRVELNGTPVMFADRQGEIWPPRIPQVRSAGVVEKASLLGPGETAYLVVPWAVTSIKVIRYGGPAVLVRVGYDDTPVFDQVGEPWTDQRSGCTGRTVVIRVNRRSFM